MDDDTKCNTVFKTEGSRCFTDKAELIFYDDWRKDNIICRIYLKGSLVGVLYQEEHYDPDRAEYTSDSDNDNQTFDNTITQNKDNTYSHAVMVIKKIKDDTYQSVYQLYMHFNNHAGWEEDDYWSYWLDYRFTDERFNPYNPTHQKLFENK